MNKQAVISSPLGKLREPFPAHQISKLPKPTKAQTEKVKADFKSGVRCKICGTWHHPDVVHLDYVGHAALTDRLLDTDPEWSWAPLGFTAEGLPAFDKTGGLWIKLTVCGVSRFGYGSADGKSGGDAVKEIIGDALRNAAMRFGAALDLWHKGDLHVDDEPEAQVAEPVTTPPGKAISNDQFAMLIQLIEASGTDAQAFCKYFGIASVAAMPAAKFDTAVAKLNAKIGGKASAKPAPAEDILEDSIPY